MACTQGKKQGILLLRNIFGIGFPGVLVFDLFFFRKYKPRLSKNSIIHCQVNQALRTEQFPRAYDLLSVQDMDSPMRLPN
uniref:Uncharacterized protein n=1 Tax=Solanum tuberosum TaxID=4113 RepID=M1A0R4_SOLTU